MGMLPSFLASFATFFATVGPVEAAVIFAALTPQMPRAERSRVALRAVAISSIILFGALFAGGPLLRQLGVGIPALQTAGGIILLVIALDMIFARPTSAFKLTPMEDEEAHGKEDIAIFPIATPLLAGPGAMSAVILMAAGAASDPMRYTGVAIALASVMLLTLVLLLASNELSRALGVTAQRVLMRVFGILLAAIAVQAAFNGLMGSGLFPAAQG
jgi:multiple antibiotic resistance protein